MAYQVDLENYMSFRINNKLVFVDRFQCLSSSLERVVENLGENDLKHLSQEFNYRLLGLIRQKEFYPYKYMNDFEKFKEQLPSKGKFYISLTGKKITDEDYENVFKVWNKFVTKTVKDNHDLYLKIDALLLVHVFEKFRISCLKNYGVRLTHYLGTPGLICDAMFIMTKVELDLISDVDTYFLFEIDMRDDVSYISKVCSKSNNKCLAFYDPKQGAKHIMYLDTNNLYGHSMSKFLPTGKFN